MTFEDALATQPQWLQLWVVFMGSVIIASFVTLLFSKTTRLDALLILLANLGVYVAMMWLYQQVGFVRLLGIVHVLLWTPLALYLWGRLKNPAIDFPFRQAIWLLLSTMFVSLLFDYTDVVRYWLGDTMSMVP